MASIEDDGVRIFQTQGGVMVDDIWHRHRRTWYQKPILRTIYGEWYREIVSWLAPGLTVELGGGSGNFKECAPRVFSTDIASLPWLNAVFDGQAIPFKAGSVGNLVLVDVLHHVEQVSTLFDEAVRVLRPGGRIIILDPYISWLSWPIYKWLHPEPVDLRARPLLPQLSNPARQPFDSNQAVATILFERSFNEFAARYPSLRRVFQRRLAFIAYPLSGGFEHQSLVPSCFVGPILAIERGLQWLGRLLAFRILVVVERQI